MMGTRVGYLVCFFVFFVFFGYKLLCILYKYCCEVFVA